MDSIDLPGLAAFLAVAEAGSFTTAAARLGVSPSAISQQLRALERRLGCALLHRTTRSVRLTDDGERYRDMIAPAVAAIYDAASVLGDEDGEPQGALRLTVPRTAYHALLRPILPRYLSRYPKVRIELSIDNRLVDIVRDGFDGGVRFGNLIQQDMVARRIGPDMRIALLAAPRYLDFHGRPAHPRDLASHICVGFRAATTGVVETWHLTKAGDDIRFTPAGPLVVNTTEALIAAAEDGIGIVEFVEDLARDALDAGRLERVLPQWCPSLPGFHLYYPDRRRKSGALQALLAMLIDDRDR
jgi:DNA-binding transcriptional LysR family regulator